MEITEEETRRLEEIPGRIEDERQQSGLLLHKPVDVPVMGLTTVIACRSGFAVMKDFGKTG